MPTISYYDDDTSESDDNFDENNIIDITSQESFNTLCLSSLDQNATELDLHVNKCHLVSSELMSHLTSLKTFSIYCSDSSLKDDFLLNLPESLEEISICAYKPMSTEQQQPLCLNISKFHNLRELNLSKIPLMEGTFEGIGTLENLTDLGLESVASIDGLINIGNCTKLKNLALTNQESLDDATLIEIIGNNSNLKSLYIEGSPNITNYSLEFIQILPHLKELFVSKCESVTFTFSTEMPALKRFSSDKCGNTAIQSFIKLLLLAPNLSVLDVTGYPDIIELIQVINLIVQERENQKDLRMRVDIPLGEIDTENLSPKLKITEYPEIIVNSGDISMGDISPP